MLQTDSFISHREILLREEGVLGRPGPRACTAPCPIRIHTLTQH